MAKEKSRRMAENNIPYKVRAALLLVPLNADRIFMLVKNHVLAVSGMGDEAPPTPGGRNGGSDVL